MRFKKSTIIFGILFLSLIFMSAGINAADSTTSFDSTNSEIGQIISMLNQSGGIPIKITTTASTNWTQFAISLMVGSIFILFFFGSLLISGMKAAATKIYFYALKEKTKRHILFIKHTESALFSTSMINSETVNQIAEALNEFKGKPFDLILHTPGGEVFSAMYISRILKQYPGYIRTIVPMVCMSGGTLLALSTDELVMAPTACLGPVDPQIGSLFKFGSAKSWDYIRKFKGKKADDSSLSMALTGKQYTKSIRAHLVNIMDFGLNDEQKKTFANFLTSGDVEHAFALTPSELTKFGLKIRNITNSKFMAKMINFISKTGKEGVTYV